ncbi:hypothetical protein ASPWEDRAFT_121806 [Aspergillus wentii DTO 134E9]|uniref:Zn(2)-C6 fungal-type domain-containing protein n=1 Tax=Aspergillus wentii DTO 134E9 TaxID=1073089 RepID=A0A1L9R517_ASPWE|nr:uncharacterized protein ASPWEDRAFT_121806 [Aspergillus wentii DTO 134E9]OJJ30000.1 hypothetical protein ASPWEDRAFT_121806 [Aspergillus wentii DTO 134E9]
MSPGQVCARCARIKQRCDGESPCSRCARLGHICEERGSKSPPRTYRRPRASRSRGGCFSCKSRKKKCDEVKPRCSDCRRLNLPCRWNEPTEASDIVLSSPLSDDTIDEPIVDPIFDDIFPDTISLLSLPGSTNPHLRTDDDRSLFNHYLHTVARALSRSDNPDGNPFLAILLPIAAASDAVSSSILALSGCHWKRVYPSIWNCALRRQGRALAQVNTLLTLSDPQSTLEACTGVLLLCLTEVFDGTSRAWKSHLKGASAILKAPKMQGMASTPEWSFCITLFHYLDSMSTISRCKPPLLHTGEGILDLTSLNRSAPSFESDGSVDAIYGISPALFDFLGMVNLLANHRSRRVDELANLGFQTAAAHISRQIHEWRSGYEAIVDKETDSATTAFEWAIRLRLHQIVNGYAAHPIVEESVNIILDAVLEIPYASKVEGCLLFPLMIAGAASVSVERRMMVKERLMVMENTLGFGHIQSTRMLLERIWEGEMEMNWASVRYTHFPGVVFV